MAVMVWVSSRKAMLTKAVLTVETEEMVVV